MNFMTRLSAAVLLAACGANAQLGLFNAEQRRAITREWSGERFEDGRPKVADTVLERLKTATAEEARSEERRVG